MADGKKSFILYADQIHLFENLSDEEAGVLIKHIFKYVNDMNPECDRLTTIAFEPIKQQLKRNLKDWEETKIKRSIAGKLGMESRWNNKNNKGITEITSVIDVKENITNITVNDNVNVSVNDNVKEENYLDPLQDKKDSFKIIDYQITKESPYEEKVIKQFHSLFCTFATPTGSELKDKTLLKAKMDSWKKDMNGLTEIDKRSRPELLEVYNFLKSSPDRFWSATVSSLGGIRKNFDKISAKIRLEKENANKPKETSKNTSKEENRVFPGVIDKSLIANG